MLKAVVCSIALSGSLGFISAPATAQQVVHALTGTVSSINSTSKTISVFQDNGTQGDFSDATDSKAHLSLDKKVSLETTAADIFKKTGAYVVVLYYGGGINAAMKSGGLASFLLLFVLRGILSPFAHVTFTSMTGIGCGISRESHNGFVKFVMPIVGYIGAVTLHAVWNGMGFVVTNILIAAGLGATCTNVGLGGDNIGLCGFFTGYLVLEVPLFFILVFIAWRIVRRQKRILNEMLALDVARGLITEEHAKIAMSAFRSSRWLLSGIFAGKYLARSRYLRAVGKLGLSYWHIQRATAAQGQTARFQQNPLLRDEVLRWREAV